MQIHAQPTSTGSAQAYPVKPIRLILPFPPSGGTDTLGRGIAQTLSAQIGQQVVADNRPGAGGNLGLELASRAPPDGYTMVLSSPLIAISPMIYAKLNYDPEKDLAPVTWIAFTRKVLVVHPSVPVKTMKELVELARRNSGKLNFGSGGVGTSVHLTVELLKSLTGVNIVHVPYKGTILALGALVAGEIDMVVGSMSLSWRSRRPGGCVRSRSSRKPAELRWRSCRPPRKRVFLRSPTTRGMACSSPGARRATSSIA